MRGEGRFELLDGVRGIAAIIVMLYHYGGGDWWWLGGSWSAVDLFFVLSGLVIARSYGPRILAGLSFPAFMAVRLRRLAPMYLLGLAIGAAAMLAHILGPDRPPFSPAQLAGAVALGALWLPYPGTIDWPFGAIFGSGALFPLNDPAWSLFFEMAVNIAFWAYVARFRRLGSLVGVGLALIAFAAATALTGEVNPGWSLHSLLPGIPRVTVMFFAGALIFARGWHRARVPVPVVALVSLLGLAGMLAGDQRLALVNATLVLPVAVWMLSATPAPAALVRPCRLLGALSYPLYILHFPLARLVQEVFGGWGGPPARQVALGAALAIGAALAAAWAEGLVRARLAARLRPSMAEGRTAGLGGP